MENVIAIIVTYNRKQLLEECLEAVLKQTVTVYKIILIDNASTDGTEMLFKNGERYDLPQIEYHKMSENLGGSGGFYEGIKLCREDTYSWAWIMDDDTIPNADCLEKLLKAKDKIDGKIGFLASYIKGPNDEAMNVPTLDMTPSKNGYPFWYKYLNEKCVQVAAATFVSILVNQEAVLKCGLPCKDYFIWGDDAEYTQRISTHYAPCYFVGDSVAVHKRYNAKKLDIMLETDPKRLQMFQYYFRNMTINMGVFYGKVKMRKLIVHNFKLSIKMLLKHDPIRAKVIFMGTVKAVKEYGVFENYISGQISE